MITAERLPKADFSKIVKSFSARLKSECLSTCGDKLNTSTCQKMQKKTT